MKVLYSQAEFTPVQVTVLVKNKKGELINEEAAEGQLCSDRIEISTIPVDKHWYDIRENEVTEKKIASEPHMEWEDGDSWYSMTKNIVSCDHYARVVTDSKIECLEDGSERECYIEYL